jgi:hypothetical protein
VAELKALKATGVLEPVNERREKFTPPCPACKLPLVKTDPECPRCHAPVPWPSEAARCKTPD